MRTTRNKLFEGWHRSLRIFDFDDTLALTKSMIRVVGDDGAVRHLTPGEYAVYVPRAGDIFDYSDFEHLIEPREIKSLTKILKRVVTRHGVDAAVVLTARGSAKPVHEFLDAFNLPQIPVVALDTSDPLAKAYWIKSTVMRLGLERVEFFDDSVKNVVTAKSVMRTMPEVKFRARLIVDGRLK
jgi:hypothetical protein